MRLLELPPPCDEFEFPFLFLLPYDDDELEYSVTDEPYVTTLPPDGDVYDTVSELEPSYRTLKPKLERIVFACEAVTPRRLGTVAWFLFCVSVCSRSVSSWLCRESLFFLYASRSLDRSVIAPSVFLTGTCSVVLSPPVAGMSISRVRVIGVPFVTTVEAAID